MLAVVIPFYKIKFFESTLDSLSNQTDKRFNVYVGNDASPENPLALINQYSEKINLVYKAYESNLGNISLVKHWERCIKLLNEERWIMIVGDDDILGKNVVAEFYKHLEFFDQKSYVVRFASQLVDEDSSAISKVFNHPKWEKPEDSYFRKIRGKTRSSLSEYIFSKKSFQKYKFHHFPLAWHSDDRAWMEFSQGLRIYTINEAVVYIRVTGFSISGRMDNIFLKHKASVAFYKFLVSQNLFEFTIEQENLIIKNYEKHLSNYGRINIKDLFF